MTGMTYDVGERALAQIAYDLEPPRWVALIDTAGQTRGVIEPLVIRQPLLFRAPGPCTVTHIRVTLLDGRVALVPLGRDDWATRVNEGDNLIVHMPEARPW